MRACGLGQAVALGANDGTSPLGAQPMPVGQLPAVGAVEQGNAGAALPSEEAPPSVSSVAQIAGAVEKALQGLRGL
jgi:hypothetical protein